MCWVLATLDDAILVSSDWCLVQVQQGAAAACITSQSGQWQHRDKMPSNGRGKSS